MKRNKSLTLTSHAHIEAQKRRIAYHEAGHAAAILVNNELKQLPPIFFRINIHDSTQNSTADTNAILLKGHNYSAEIEGGRLIKHVPESLECFIDNIDQNKSNNTVSFLTVFIADIVNLLIGPLAEAKHVAISDGEVFNKNLITVSALHNYGGSSDLTLINEYLECFSSSKNEQDNLLAELLDQAFDFVNNYSNWKKIRLLARHILDEDIKTIDYNEINALLSQSKLNESSLNKFLVR
ncbi:hypothetical protein AU255_15815 [Methyloprofundus sedimenti]|uniref:Peptidase M41 domain-containing protein n=1 Tax=Methyloprofundus sedimenti TaxID=1420851 RepID=A0A1V8M297_9GAMM|nr:hypothetical protein [Methyloprofundus sedimenti]OQK15681.1 hypothetical protein AU255_15815 [Methyloprofundus sedimenti]